MPVKTNLWKVGASPKLLDESSLSSEQYLEDLIVADPRILSREWMLIGRQVHTPSGGIIDLLALAPDGSLVLIELKRDRTPRDVVAQALDYAFWVEKLNSEDIVSIYSKFVGKESLAADFEKHFGQTLDEDELNTNHQIVIAAVELDSSTERIVQYLSDRDVAINVLSFQVFSDGSEQYLTRTWLLDPVESQVAASASRNKQSEPWNGEFYCSFGDQDARSWDEAREYGFISGGGAAWYNRTLQLLKPGDRVWINIPRVGYVGVGRVRGYAQMASEFLLTVDDEKIAAMDVLKKASYHRSKIDDEENCEYFVPIDWSDAKPIDEAFREVGLFGNQNTVCKPTTPKWRSTVERLKDQFKGYCDDQN